MPSITVATAARGVSAPSRRRVVMTSTIGALTLPCTSPNSVIEGLGPKLVELDRSQDYTLLRRGAKQRNRVALDVTMYPLADQAVEDQINLLERMAYGPAMGVSYGPWESARRWAIRDLRVTIGERFPGTHAIRDATAAVSLIEAVDEGVPQPSNSPNVRKAITYKVVKGDRLASIAARYATTVARLVADNKAKYPRLKRSQSIAVGWVLTIK